MFSKMAHYPKELLAKVTQLCMPVKFLPTHLESLSLYPSGQAHMAPAIGAGKSIQDCPAIQDIEAQPSALFSQMFPSYAKVCTIKMINAVKSYMRTCWTFTIQDVKWQLKVWYANFSAISTI